MNVSYHKEQYFWSMGGLRRYGTSISYVDVTLSSPYNIGMGRLKLLLCRQMCVKYFQYAPIGFRRYGLDRFSVHVTFDLL